jgi:excisionase family DNA binding protein
MTVDLQPLLIATNEAAVALGISPRLLRQLESRGQIPSCRIGRLVRYSPDALSDWVREQSKPDQ